MAECPWEALSDPELPDGAKVVLAALWRHAGSSGRFVWPSRDTLSRRCGMSPRTLRRHLATLRARQWVTEAQGVETHGHPGWHLCDPPGVPVATGIEGPVGEAKVGDHPECSDSEELQPKTPICRSPPRTTRTDRSATNLDLTPDNPGRTKLDARPELTAEKTRTDRALLYGNQQVEPTGGGCSQDLGECGAKAPPPPRRSVSAQAWRSDFVFRWRRQFNPETRGGTRVSDPTGGAHRLVELQRMLDEHGGDVVAEVLLHAGERVVRHHESGMRADVGLPPRMFAVTFRADKPQAFDALLDAWQADKRRKRRSGRTPAAPAELDGRPLTDEEQRVWHTAFGEDPERAVREHRRRQDASDFASGLLSGFEVRPPEATP